MKKRKIIVCDAIHQKGFDILNNEEDIEVIDAVSIPKDKLLEIIDEADVAITRSSTDVDEKFLIAAKNLKAIVRAGVGVDLSLIHISEPTRLRRISYAVF